MSSNKYFHKEIEALERVNASLRFQLEKTKENPGDLPVTGCGDSSCLVSRSEGMQTNGGCRCDEQKLRRALLYWRRKSQFLQETIKTLRQECDENNAKTFDAAWEKKKEEGYQYGHDALEAVRFGWEIAKSEMSACNPDALEKAASVCESMVIGGRAWTEEQKIVADALFAAAKNIRALK